MKLYFAVNAQGEIIGMGTTPVGDSEISIEVKDLLFEELKNDMSSFKIMDNKIVKSLSIELKNKKNQKKQELNVECNQHILDGFDITIDEIVYRFTYKEEDQLNFQETYWLFANDNIESIVWSVKNGDKSARVLLNKQMFSEIYMASVKHKQGMISKLKDSLYPIIDDASSVEMIEHITWDTIVVEPELPPVVIKSDNTLPMQIEVLKLSKEESERDIRLLEAQVQASNDYTDFLEEVIVEIAQTVYS